MGVLICFSQVPPQHSWSSSVSAAGHGVVLGEVDRPVCREGPRLSCRLIQGGESLVLSIFPSLAETIRSFSPYIFIIGNLSFVYHSAMYRRNV